MVRKISDVRNLRGRAAEHEVEQTEHAVVLGASMGGLLVARVLSHYYRTVTVVERDALPNGVEQRRGVPQGRHVHALWHQGWQILDGLFPGLGAELINDGAKFWGPDSSKCDMYFGGHHLVRPGKLHGFKGLALQSRPFLEDHVRRRVRAIPNVTILDGHEFGELTCNEDRSRVTGVTISSREGHETQTIGADLVVDTTGRGSRTPVFLESFGYDRPEEDEVVGRLAYSSQFVRIPAGTLREVAVLNSPVPGRATGVAIVACEDDMWVVTSYGMLGTEPPSDFAGVLDFIEEFTPAHVMSVLRRAEPIGEVSRFRTPSNRWRRYDKMTRFPAGLLVFGDAICSFNPIYGQGMTVAAMEAAALQRCLRRGRHDLAQRFFRAAVKPINMAWQVAVGGDLALPEVVGPRPLSVRLANRYVEWVQTASETSLVAGGQFLKVAALSAPSSSLFAPRVLLAVASANWGRRRQSGAEFAAAPAQGHVDLVAGE